MTPVHDFRREASGALRLALPIILVQFGTMLMGTVDVMMLGRVSEVDLASAGIGNAVAFGLLVFPMGLLGALDPLASQAYGAGDRERLARYLKQGLVVAAVLSIPISAVMWEARPLLRILGQPPEIVDGASRYLRAVIPGNLALLAYTALQRTLQSMSIVRPAFVAMAIANVANFFADYTLIFGRAGLPALGVAGAGSATSISRWVLVICLAVGARRTLATYWGERVPDLWRWRSYRTFFRIGTAIGVHISLEYWLFACVSLMMGSLGALEAASHQVAINLTSLAYMMALGIAEAAATRVGNAVGRGDMGGARLSAKVCLGLGISVMAVSGLIFFAAPRLLARLYSPDPEIVVLASTLIRIAAFFELFDAVQSIAGGVLRGTADTRVPATLALVGYWVLGLPLGALLAFRGGLGPQGLWWGLTIGLASVAVLLAARVRRRFRAEIAAVE